MSKKIAAAFLLLASSCLKPASLKCGDLLCPNGTVCAPAGDRCVTVAQVSSCTKKAEGEACNTAGAPAAECLKGVCVSVLCGDGIVETGEVCDDGNTVSCDGCSGDCRSNETCGNAIVDCAEQCDDGATNSNAPNALCRSDCHRQSCGDGVVDDRSGEDCDGTPNPTTSCSSFGFYGGSVGCSSACRSDTSTCAGFCGDGQINGEELCDGRPPAGETCLDFGYDVGVLHCAQLCTPSFIGCERMGFEPVDLQGAVVNFYWIRGRSPSDVYAVGQGIIFHYDGQKWSQETSGTTSALLSVWSNSATDSFVVGDTGTILHNDGTGWTPMTPPANVADVKFNDVWASAADNVYVVGGLVDSNCDETIDPDPCQGTVLHYDGHSWTFITTPAKVKLVGLWGSAPNDIYTVGYSPFDDASDGGSGPTMLHYDGANWTKVDVSGSGIDAESDFEDVWGSGPHDIFAVADDGEVIHYDGSSWKKMVFPPTNQLDSVWGSGPNDVYASGNGGIFHYEGHGWSPIKSGTTDTIYSVWSSGPDDVYGISASGILHFSGGPTLAAVDPSILPFTTQEGTVCTSDTDCTAVTGGPGTCVVPMGQPGSCYVPTAATDLFGVWGSSASDVFTVGADGEALHFDGSQWKSMSTGIINGDALTFVWGTSATDVYAVGDEGYILHYDGNAQNQWATLSSPGGPSLTANTLEWIWGTGPNDIYFVGEAGTILWFDGTFHDQTTAGGATVLLNGAWGSGPNDVYVTGNAGTIIHSTDHGTSWQPVTPAFTAQDIGGAWGTGPNDVFAVADPDGIYHFDGASWSKMTLNSSKAYDYVIGDSKTDAFAMAEGGTALVHYDGADWAPLALPVSGLLWGQWMTSTYGYVVGNDGSMIQLDRHCTATENDCSDRWDNDCDGLLNCADPDCNSDPYCGAGGECQTLTTAACGASINGNNAGAQPLLERYSCASRLDTGPERYYRFTAEASGSVTVTLSNLSSDLDIVVLGTQPSGGCDPLAECVAADATESSQKTVTFTAVEGSSYYFIVDGYAGAIGTYTLAVSCQ